MAIQKSIPKSKERASVGVYVDTKERFDNLVDMLNHKNKQHFGNKARKITKDDVLNELISAYTHKEEGEK
tara:strand:- start:6352 stop:6561 length:210 start_codon:yes stop_codon:yes gene_type:complete